MIQVGKKFVVAISANVLIFSMPYADEKLPSTAELEAAGAVIGNIVVERDNVFDTSQPGENKLIFRLANRWHTITRETAIREQLLFTTGEPFSARLLTESERLLRKNAYLYDAKIEAVQFAGGVVDIRVRTKDLWTLMPGFSVSRSGGENRSRVTVSERNLLGQGVSVRLSYREDVDRRSTSFQYSDRNVGDSWTALFAEVSDSSDGDTLDLRLTRPFYALDSRWSAGGSVFDDSRENSFYDLGNEAAEYSVETAFHTAFFGWSAGLSEGWVRRWSAGVVFDERRFSAVPNGTLPSLIPGDRKFVYPFIGFELLQDKFESSANRDQIDRTEDFFLGTRLWASVGIATEGIGADRESIIYRFEASRGFGSIHDRALLLSSSLLSRIDEGNAANTVFSLQARYYDQISDRRLFFMTLEASRGQNLDLDNVLQLGGDTGLRGFPLRYQSGESKLLLSAEQRYFTDWYPLKLARVGGAVFADIGRTWGNNSLGRPAAGWLKDVGFGLRLVPTRSSGRDVIHVDIAFPLDGDASIDDVQFLVESKRSF